MAKTDHFERETQRLLTQMVEVRSAFADIGQRQKGISELSDSVAARNVEQQLQHERQQAQNELNRINADLRALALVREEDARVNTAQRDEAARKDALKREETNKQARLSEEIARKEQQLQNAIAQKEQQLKDAIVKEDRERAAAIAKEENAKTRGASVAPEQAPTLTNTDNSPSSKALDRSADSNPAADAVSAAAIAAVKAADVWLEVAQLAQHLLDRELQKLAQEKEREALENAIAKEASALEAKLLNQGMSPLYVEEALERWDEAQDVRRNKLEEKLEGERIELAADQTRLENNRNERADKEGISLSSSSQQVDMEQAKVIDPAPPTEPEKAPERPNDPNPLAEAFSLAAVAAVKAADVWLEVVQLAKHLGQREAQKEVQDKEREQFEKEAARQTEAVKESMTRRGKSDVEIADALKRQAEVHEKQRAVNEERFERDRQELARQQVEKERERNERADRDGLSL